MMNGKLLKRLGLCVVALAAVGAIGALVGAIGGAVVTVTLSALFSVSATLVLWSGVGAFLGATAATIWIVNVLYTHRGTAL